MTTNCKLNSKNNNRSMFEKDVGGSKERFQSQPSFFKLKKIIATQKIKKQ